MRKLVFLFGLTTPLAAQTPAVRLINAADASSPHAFGTVATVRQLPGGGVLVNDVQKRQLSLLDPSLAPGAVVADSASGTANSYGVRPGGLIPYVGDSTLFVDPAGLSMFVIDPAGKIARVASVPRSQDAPSLGSSLFGNPGLDAKGRLVYRSASIRIARPAPSANGKGLPTFPDPPDSAALVRVDLTTRKLDTAAFFKIPKIKMNVQQTENGISITNEQNPMPIVDDWAVLADGSIAIVRGRDYHLDILHADGSMSSSAKVPFDWQRLSDEDKVAVVDSAKAAFERARTAIGNNPSANGRRVDGGGRGDGTIVMSFRGGEGGGIRTGDNAGMPPVTFISPSELPDYRPAFTANAARADLDGNLWIRTSATRAGAVAGPIYDVINAKGELVDRVQVPAGRQVVGFGKGGVVYLAASDASGAWLERTHR
ncbi:MAG TPA: hypothetical protein VLN49_11720 [Gemmatimonadaceae bacterium]|nr:hypothetical protein [Gemmatimonadaceae bacterium]